MSASVHTAPHQDRLLWAITMIYGLIPSALSFSPFFIYRHPTVLIDYSVIRTCSSRTCPSRRRTETFILLSVKLCVRIYHLQPVIVVEGESRTHTHWFTYPL
ncbi:hypothetical protein F4811DRAFT_515698 [Daldinia bambusicola]|nr:hypothetical protein F4811DRAFT_515698 [Daldinia bambusicola]